MRYQFHGKLLKIDKICELFAYIYVGYYSTFLKADFHSDFIKRQVI